MLLLRWCLLASGIAWIPPSSLPKLQTPNWEPTYDMALSTIAMPCNASGYMDAKVLAQYGLVSWDWSNAKAIWVNESPMDSESKLATAAAQVKAANPRAKVFTYRNSVHAMPWFPTVREKLEDPRYSGFFLRFDPAASNSSVPACDDA